MADIIATLMKDEDNLVADFILHHISLGFYKIIIYDDQSTIPVSEHVAALPLQVQTKVEVHRLPSDFYEWRETPPDAYFHETELLERFPASKQFYFCNLALLRHATPDDWVAFIDVDEFLWLGSFNSIGEMRQQAEERGFSTIVFDMLLYGHGYHLTPPTENNICAFLWRSTRLYGHGKYFVRAGSSSLVTNIHFPSLVDGAVACNPDFSLRDTEFNNRPLVKPTVDMPHLKHYIIQDVFTCFRRRLRLRISQGGAITPQASTWRDRINLLTITSEVRDSLLATSLLHTRTRLGLPITAHVNALAIALSASQEASVLDTDALRSGLPPMDKIETDAELLFRYFSQSEPDTSLLRFAKPPEDFDPKIYRDLYNDLKTMSQEALAAHYINHGRREGRRYRPVPPPPAAAAPATAGEGIQPRSFEIIYLEELYRKFTAGNADIPGIEMKPLAEAYEITIPAPSYGDDPDSFPHGPTSIDKGGAGTVRIPPPLGFALKDCTVWSKYGIIFIGDYIIRETLFHFPMHQMPEISLEGEKHRERRAIVTADLTPRTVITRAITTLAGIQQNYYHWFMFALPKLNHAIIDAWPADASAQTSVLVPDGMNAYQEASMKALLDTYQLPALSVAEKDVLKVGTLHFSNVVSGSGLIQHKFIKQELAPLSRLAPSAITRDKKLFISRSDSRWRTLENEAELTALAQLCGFEVMTLSDLSLEAQIALFSAATHVISAHGAGLTNLIFCQPGTKVLELHMNIHMNWCYRRLCALYGLEYAFICGSSTTESVWTAHFSIPLSRFEETMIASGFLNETNVESS